MSAELSRYWADVLEVDLPGFSDPETPVDVDDCRTRDSISICNIEREIAVAARLMPCAVVC